VSVENVRVQPSNPETPSLSHSEQPQKPLNLLDIVLAVVLTLFSNLKWGAGECVEVRMFDKRKKIAVAGWFDSPEALATAVATLSRDGYGEPGSPRHIQGEVYWTINPVDDALLARQKNTICLMSETTTDASITRLAWQVANATLVKLEELGFPESCLVAASSGNGYHVLVRLPDLPNAEPSRTLLKRCLAALQSMVGNDQAEIDQKVYNASRILKAYGTMACKGESTDERPWRLSKLMIVPEQIEPCNLELLEKLASLAPDTAPKRDSGEKRRGPWTEQNLQAYLDWTGWDAKGPAEYNGGFRWVGTCVADDSHRDAAVILWDTGWWSYTCFHSSCEPTHSAAAFQAHWETIKGEKYPIPGRDLLVAGADSGLVDLDLAEAAGGEGDAKALVEASQKEPKRFNSTDSGNSERLVHLFGSHFRYCPQRGWYAWRGKRWATDDIGRIFCAALNSVRLFGQQVDKLASNEDETEALKKWALRSEMRTQLSNMIFLAQSAKGVTVRMSDFDRDLWAFNCANGTIDLHTGELRPHNQADLLTNIAPVKFDPTATCPQWESFLHDIMDGNREMIDFLQRASASQSRGAAIGKKGERSACASIALAVDARSGAVLAPEATDSSVAAGEALANVFLKAIQACRTLPKEVRVRSQRLKDCLAPLMESFGVAVRVASQLPASDEARSHLLGFFRGDIGGR
jgi:hypothetical protein